MEIDSTTYFQEKTDGCLVPFENAINDISLFKQNPNFIDVENFLYLENNTFYIENIHCDSKSKSYDYGEPTRWTAGVWKITYKVLKP